MHVRLHVCQREAFSHRDSETRCTARSACPVSLHDTVVAHYNGHIHTLCIHPLTRQVMSLNSETEKGSMAAPRLAPSAAGYATWAPRMTVFLQQRGAEGIHLRQMEEAQWRSLSTQVTAWHDEALTTALALAGLDPQGGSGSGPGLEKREADPAAFAQVKESRKVLIATVERSHRAFGLLYASLPDELCLQVAHLPQGWAYGLWAWLQAKFQGTEEDSVDSLFSEWTALRQDGDESFDQYRARVNRLRTLLELAKEKPSERMVTFTLLGKLQPHFKPAVLALKNGELLKQPENIDWERVTAFLNAHERSEMRLGDRESHRAAALLAQQKSSGPQAGGFSTHGSNGGDRRGGPHARSGNGSQQGASSRPASEVQCYKCKGFGHIRPDCPEVKKGSTASSSSSRDGHRGPGGKFKKQGRAAAAVQGATRHGNPYESDSGSDRESQPQSGGKTSGKDLGYSAVLIQGLSKGQRRAVSMAATSPKTNVSEPVRARQEVTKKPSQAKPKKPAMPVVESKSVLPATVSAAASAQDLLASTSWGVDTMASLHVSGNKALFSGLRACAAADIQVADGRIVRTAYRGTVVVPIAVVDGRSMKATIKDVYYHPSFSANLLSWGKLNVEGWQLHSAGADTHLLTPGGSKVSLITDNCISVLDGAEHVAPQRTFALGELRMAKVEHLVRLHEKLGHMGFDRMVRLVKGGQTMDLGKLHASANEIRLARERVQECAGCAAGKTTRAAFGHRGLDRGTAPGETLHFDCFYVKYMRDGQKVVDTGMVGKDPFTSFTWVHSPRTKDEAAHFVIDTVKLAQKQFSCKVKRIYTDGGTEFINATLQSYCKKEGITLHWPPTATQQLNGVSERAVRQVKNDLGALMHHAGVPMRFWYRGACHAVYVWNRSHVASRSGKTPWEAMLGRKPSSKHWGVFGCNAFYHVPKDQRVETFSSKAEPAVYLGHDSARGCAIVWSLRAHKLVYTRDVKYRLRDFTFAAAVGAGHDAVQEALRRSTTADAEAAPVSDDNEAEDSMSSIPDSDEQEYTVERILAQRFKHGRVEYQVKWAGYGDADNTWEPVENLAGTKALDDFERMVSVDLDEVESAGEADPESDSKERVSASEHESDHFSECDELEEGSSTSASASANAVPAAAPRRSARSHASSASHDRNPPVHHLVHMVMRAVNGMQAESHAPYGESPAGQLPMRPSCALMLQQVMAVASGLAALEDNTPATYREAMRSPDAAKWEAGMDAEMAACEELRVWDLVPRKAVPAGNRILQPKWVYKVKVDEHGQIERYKCRITPKGFMQQEGINYFDTFARTGMYKTMRAGLTLAAKWDHELDQLDVPTAFLNADVEEDVYMELPEGYRAGKEHLVCKLRKALYGLKQAPRNWYLLFSGFIQSELGFKPSVSDPCLVHKRSRTGRLMLMFLFVDDCQVSYHAEDRREWEELKAMLVKEFRTKDLGPSTWILGMRITRDRAQRTIKLDQEQYITRALERYGLAECKTVNTPEVVGRARSNASSIPSKESPANAGGEELEAAAVADDFSAGGDGSSTELSAAERQLYMEITGTLMYAAISTRLDISHAVHCLASHMQSPSRQHLQDAKRVLRYLAGTKDIGLMFGGSNEGKPCDSRGHGGIVVDVCAYADADWANNTADRKSITGWVAKLNGDPISWSSKKQRTVALSTCEAELYAEAAAIQEVLWMRGLLKELGLRCRTGSVVYGDNQSTIAVSKNGVRSNRTKHVDIKYHFITETVERGEVRLQWVPTTEQQADIFTKALAAPVFEHFRRQLMTR